MLEAGRRLFRFSSAALALGLVANRFTRRRVDGEPAERGAPNPPAPPPARQTEEGQHAEETEPRKRPFGSSRKYQLLLKKPVNHFIDDDCTTMAAAIAYYTTFSIAPLLLLIISIVGLVFGRQAVQHEIQTQIQGLIGQGAATQVGAMVQNAGKHSSTGILGAVLGVLALLAGATGAFTQLQSSLNQVWHVKPDPRSGGIKNFVGQRVLSLGMILAIAFLLLVSLAVSAALSAAGDYLSNSLPDGFSGPLLNALEFLVSLAVITALFATIFKFLPDAKIRWRDVWIGAAITSLLFTAGKFLISMYLAHSGAASAYGAAGSFVLIVLWIYYSALIFLFGAELTVAWSEAYSGSVQPRPGAVKVVMQEKVEPEQAA